MFMQNFWGQIRCIMGDVLVAYSRNKKGRLIYAEEKKNVYWEFVFVYNKRKYLFITNIPIYSNILDNIFIVLSLIPDQLIVLFSLELLTIKKSCYFLNTVFTVLFIKYSSDFRHPRPPGMGTTLI